jgi:hypothetical protein
LFGQRQNKQRTTQGKGSITTPFTIRFLTYRDDFNCHHNTEINQSQLSTSRWRKAKAVAGKKEDEGPAEYRYSKVETNEQREMTSRGKNKGPTGSTESVDVGTVNDTQDLDAGSVATVVSAITRTAEEDPMPPPTPLRHRAFRD